LNGKFLLSYSSCHQFFISTISYYVSRGKNNLPVFSPAIMVEEGEYPRLRTS